MEDANLSIIFHKSDKELDIGTEGMLNGGLELPDLGHADLEQNLALLQEGTYNDPREPTDTCPRHQIVDSIGREDIINHPVDEVSKKLNTQEK